MTITNTTQAAEQGYLRGMKARMDDFKTVGHRVAWCDDWAIEQCPSDDKIYRKIYARQFKKAYFNDRII